MFKTRLKTEMIGNHHKLLSPLVFKSSIAGVGIIAVPVGFITDFASVPRIPLVYALTGNTSHRAAVVHDYLYHKGEIPRETADKVFLEAMKYRNVPFWRRQAMYWAVRLCGGGHYMANGSGSGSDNDNDNDNDRDNNRD